MTKKAPRFRARKRGDTTYYFYDHGGKPRRETALGKDYGRAIKRWAEIEHATSLPPAAVLLFAHVADAYAREMIPKKAPRTQRDNKVELANLLEYFNDPPAPFESITAGDVYDYMRWRESAPIRATREKALLSHIWNWARGKRYTNLPNPCAGIKGERAGRDAYIEDADYKAIWTAANETLRDAMDLAYLTGQRPADVLKMMESDIRDDVLRVRQNKTGTKLRMTVAGSLPALLARIDARKRKFKVHCTRLVVNPYGKPIGVHALSRHWTAACAAAGVTGYQFRDIRAKAATDAAEAAGSTRRATKLLGHADEKTTTGYLRNRVGELVALAGELHHLHPDAENAENEKKESAPKGA